MNCVRAHAGCSTNSLGGRPPDEGGDARGTVSLLPRRRRGWVVFCPQAAGFVPYCRVGNCARNRTWTPKDVYKLQKIRGLCYGDSVRRGGHGRSHRRAPCAPQGRSSETTIRQSPPASPCAGVDTCGGCTRPAPVSGQPPARASTRLSTMCVLRPSAGGAGDVHGQIHGALDHTHVTSMMIALRGTMRHRVLWNRQRDRDPAIRRRRSRRGFGASIGEGWGIWPRVATRWSRSVGPVVVLRGCRSKSRTKVDGHVRLFDEVYTGGQI